jgi:hypothetical protein
MGARAPTFGYGTRSTIGPYSRVPNCTKEVRRTLPPMELTLAVFCGKRYPVGPGFHYSAQLACATECELEFTLSYTHSHSLALELLGRLYLPRQGKFPCKSVSRWPVQFGRLTLSLKRFDGAQRYPTIVVPRIYKFEPTTFAAMPDGIRRNCRTLICASPASTGVHRLDAHSLEPIFPTPESIVITNFGNERMYLKESQQEKSNGERGSESFKVNFIRILPRCFLRFSGVCSLPQGQSSSKQSANSSCVSESTR